MNSKLHYHYLIFCIETPSNLLGAYASSVRRFIDKTPYRLFVKWWWTKIMWLYAASTLDWNKIFVQFLSLIILFSDRSHLKNGGNTQWLFQDSSDIWEVFEVSNFQVVSIFDRWLFAAASYEFFSSISLSSANVLRINLATGKYYADRKLKHLQQVSGSLSNS